MSTDNWRAANWRTDIRQKAYIHLVNERQALRLLIDYLTAKMPESNIETSLRLHLRIDLAQERIRYLDTVLMPISPDAVGW